MCGPTRHGRPALRVPRLLLGEAGAPVRFCPGAQRAEACPDPTARNLGGWRRPICFRTPPRTSHLQPPGGGGSWGQTRSWGSAREPEIHSPEVPKGPDCRPTDWRAGEGVVCYTPVRGRQGKACEWVCVCAQSCPSCPWDIPGKNTGVGSISLLQGIFQPRDRTLVSRIAGGFFTS